NVCRPQTLSLHSRVGEPPNQAAAGRVERLLRRGAVARHGAGDSPVNNQADATSLRPPGQLRDRAVQEEASGCTRRAQVMLDEAQIDFRERSADRTRLNVLAECPEIGGPGGLVLDEQLHYPRVVVQLVEAVLERAFQSVAHF